MTDNVEMFISERRFALDDLEAELGEFDPDLSFVQIPLVEYRRELFPYPCCIVRP